MANTTNLNLEKISESSKLKSFPMPYNSNLELLDTAVANRLDISNALRNNLTNANDNTLNGMWFVNAGNCANLPVSTTGVFFQLVMLGYYQIALQYSNSGIVKVYHRNYANSKWYPWTRIDMDAYNRMTSVSTTSFNGVSGNTTYGSFSVQKTGNIVTLQWAGNATSLPNDTVLVSSNSKIKPAGSSSLIMNVGQTQGKRGFIEINVSNGQLKTFGFNDGSLAYTRGVLTYIAANDDAL